VENPKPLRSPGFSVTWIARVLESLAGVRREAVAAVKKLTVMARIGSVTLKTVY
jgi:hypothetical protein